MNDLKVLAQIMTWAIEELRFMIGFDIEDTDRLDFISNVLVETAQRFCDHHEGSQPSIDEATRDMLNLGAVCQTIIDRVEQTQMEEAILVATMATQNYPDWI